MVTIFGLLQKLPPLWRKYRSLWLKVRLYLVSNACCFLLLVLEKRSFFLLHSFFFPFNWFSSNNICSSTGRSRFHVSSYGKFSFLQPLSNNIDSWCIPCNRNSKLLPSRYWKCISCSYTMLPRVVTNISIQICLCR